MPLVSHLGHPGIRLKRQSSQSDVWSEEVVHLLPPIYVLFSCVV